jgi:phosphoglycerate dehydrogenase-like enzyme
MRAAMTDIAVLDDYQGIALSYADWPRLGADVRVVPFREHIADPDQLVRALLPFDVVVAMRERTPLPRVVIERLPNLKLLVTTGPFNAAIDGAAVRDRGVVYCGTGGVLRNTAELTWALILACARQLPREVQHVREGGWMLTVGTDLHGATLALCGLGRLGAMVATVGRAFGMHVIAWSQNLTAARAAEVGVELVGRDELFSRADFLSVHLVLSDRTRGLIGARELALMKPSAWLINTSRGPIVDEAALADACARGAIAGAGLDTFSVEPLPADHAFRRLTNVVATPHIGYVTEACYRLFYRDILEDIQAWLDGRPVRLVTT